MKILFYDNLEYLGKLMLKSDFALDLLEPQLGKGVVLDYQH